MPETAAPLVLIDNYDSFTWNLYQMIQAVSPWPVRVFRNNEVRMSFLESLSPRGYILSPGPGNPTRSGDFGICADILNRLPAETPLLGVCLGYQGLVAHFGGRVIHAPEIRHGKTSPVIHTNACPLFEGVPSPFEAMRYHSLIIDEATLPDCLEVSARVAEEHLPMAVFHRTRPVMGVQFHPESVGTPHGGRILENFVNLCRQTAGVV